MKKLINFVKSHQNTVLNILVLFLFLYISFVANKFPDNFVIVDGDYNQKTFEAVNLSNYKYLWSNEIAQGLFSMLYVGYPFYYFINIFEKMGFNQSFINSLILFIFLYGSFLSFKQGTKILGLSNNISTNFLFSIIYSLNYFTFWVLSYSWGFQPHFLIYLFLPLIFSYLYETILNFNLKNLGLFLIINIFSIISYSNIVFGLVLLGVEIIFILMLWIISRKELRLKKILIVLFTQFCVIFPLFIITFLGLSNSLESKNNNWFDSQYTYKVTSNSYIDLLLNSSTSFNTKNLISENSSEWGLLNLLIYILFISQSIFLFLTISLLINGNKIKKNKFFLVVFGVFILLFILNLRYTEPFKNINLAIFNSTFEVLRSPDKIQPFFSYFLILLAYLSVVINFNIKLLRISLLVIFLFVTFFLYGGIVKIHQFEKKSNGDTYSSLVKVPKEYLELQNKHLGSDKSSTNILNLPYNIENSPNWSNYPKWKLVGTDITRNFYYKNSVTPNLSINFLSDKFEFKEFNKKKETELKLINLMQSVSTEYIIYHKDITERRYKESLHLKSIIDKLEEGGKIRKLDSNEYFDFYKLEDTLVKPLITSTETDLEFQKLNPTLYILKINNLNSSTNIEFNQSFFNGWKLLGTKNDILKKQEKREFNFNKNYINEYITEENFFQYSSFGALINKNEINEKKLLNNYSISWKVDKNYILTNFNNQTYEINEDGSINVKLMIIFLPQLYFNIYLIFIFLIFNILFFYLLVFKFLRPAK